MAYHERSRKRCNAKKHLLLDKNNNYSTEVIRGVVLTGAAVQTSVGSSVIYSEKEKIVELE